MAVLHRRTDVLQHMAQPKDPPTSLRLPPAIKAAVEAFAEKKGLTRNAAYVEVLRRGLDAAVVRGQPVVAAKNHASIEPPTKASKPFKSRLKGEWKAP